MAVPGIQDQISPHKSDLKRSRLHTKREIPYVINRMQSGHYRKNRQKSQNLISYIRHSLKIKIPKPHIFLQQHKPCEKSEYSKYIWLLKEAKQKTISSKISRKIHNNAKSSYCKLRLSENFSLKGRDFCGYQFLGIQKIRHLAGIYFIANIGFYEISQVSIFVNTVCRNIYSLWTFYAMKKMQTQDLTISTYLDHIIFLFIH